ncbi:phytoene dehydrogenase-like protein [Amycolatopsis bartoniae]|uniref:Pyridine nucleotide-disulfide oxidoreductase domain-containing protein 2 n=1 Tax=Amycolatopsis bartoniae TaxID=941986 RepID=A0A8H9ITV4_9PSEU|nr:NAD(P)/FAD-dependent oxidoreductase [Amycolatopsis bartoniae]MBB2938049.1 phytoene dehydrogenase-like protein [Amycolatopsis bartoniae]TVT09939.1 NAD(P)/FAD-dependent oxidoreductase [Amycolatopsis bartoniae]GHF32342.1 FAD-dependent oxidoreductase [Amycolatopsis bartoniae]
MHRHPQREELVEPGFRTDVCSACYPMAAVSPIIAGLGLEHYGLRWRHAPEVLAHVLPDDRVALLSRDLDRTAASLAAFAPGDDDAWRAEFDGWSRLRDDLLDALFTPFPPVRAGAKLLRHRGIAELLHFARMSVMPARALGNERFSGEGAKLLFAGNAFHADLGPGHAGSAVFGCLLCMIGQETGFPVPEGGAGVITDALVRRLADCGGRVECGREVDRVVVADGRVLGVADTEGGLVRARRAVLAAVPAPALYLHLVGPDHLPPRFVRDVRRFHWDHATVKVDWALSDPIPWRNPEAASAGTLHLDRDVAGLGHYSADLGGGTVPGHPFLIAGQMTTADPTRSPAGTESAWAYTHVPRHHDWSADELRRFADRMEAVIHRHAPSFTSRMRGRRVDGPRDLHNLVEGALNGGSAAPHQQLIFRPVPGLGRADTPIDRLFLAGAARAALARAGLGGALYRQVISQAHRVLYR